MSAQYRKLHDHFKRISHFEHFNNLGEWDLCTMMPDGGSEGRSEAMATLSSHIHEMRTEDWLSDSIQQAMQESLPAAQQANLVEMQRQVSQASLVPAKLVAAKTKAAFACEHAWREQRKNNDWQGFAPNLTGVIELAREEAQIRAEALGITPYDALLEKFEPGMTTDKLEQLFAPLRSELPGLIQQVVDKQAGEPNTSLTGKFDTAAQEVLSRKVMALLDFDFNQGRLDVSSHPFSCGVPGDIRITTRFDEDDFSSSLMSTIHETGHARYEQGLPTDWQGQPAGMARSMGMHESQSLFYEMQLARSEGFLGLIRNDINQAFGNDYSLEQLKHSFTRVNRGLIRVDADEVTYPCHILLRFDAEKALIDGSLAVKDLPEFWNANMQQLLGLSTQGNDKDGCMQDIHWTLGELGYFPSYTLGAMTAAQIRYAMEKQLGSLDKLMSNGRIKEIFNWLSANIWCKGSLMSTDELMTSATGEVLKGEYLLTHLKQRYLG
ncbi:carboxypeptidase M32 [Shewanella submarina]|uniref:Metal-dependent carboxypeptidase n=1 Tax=Shewanella submarina TaxID=2016376 RepID=A0ABV7GAX3_9GAMM|nr:carboxypeptidase M32 [Shewanella submarina]MCL1037158.1 carboxypeptidase M32 [Shewanella submarina]